MSTLSNIKQRITPECDNFKDSIVLAGVIELIMVVVVFIILVAALIYIQWYTPATNAGTENQGKNTKGLLIAAAIITLITSAIGIWQIVVGGKLKKCINACK
jgi:heme/copper-type cytochrome/quinol oxidase subunit 2